MDFETTATPPGAPAPPEPTGDDFDLMARMRVNVPAKKSGRMAIMKFTVKPGDEREDWYGSRAPEAGEYTKLVEQNHTDSEYGTVWMSDTIAECRDHLPAARRIADPGCKRVLINGLGLGCIATLALSFDHVESVCVVECDKRVIRLVGDWLSKHHSKDKDLWVVPGDAYEVEWESEPWDVVWHDIWPTMGADNLKGMQFLDEKYKDQCRWQGHWALPECMWMHDQERVLMQKIEAQDGKLPDVTHKLWNQYNEFLENEHHYAYFKGQGYGY